MRETGTSNREEVARGSGFTLRGSGRLRPRPPPVVALAAGFGVGCGLILSGVAGPAALALLAGSLLPIGLFLRPSKRLLLAALLLSVLGGVLHAAAWRGGEASDCRLRIRDGPIPSVTGRFLGRPGPRGVPFRIDGGLPGECRGRVRAYLGRGLERRTGWNAGPLRAGERIRGRAEWRKLPPREWTTPERAGYLVLESAEPAPGETLGGRLLRTRGRVQERLVRLFGDRAPVTEALVLARKEALEPALREAFARAGIAHLLAISGFHVGIVAGLVLTLARLAGAGPRRSPLLAAAAAWAYVLAIGSPDAAVRAAILLGLMALGPLRSRPLAPLGALATAFLGFLLVDPGAVGRAGFQLSFAGVTGLILWSRRWSEEIRRIGHPEARSRDRSHPPARPWLPRVPRALADGLGAALAASAATLPLVAWHFGQVPLLGVPATLVLGPVVALTIPGIFACLLLDPVLPGAADFLAGGVGLLLEVTVRGAERIAALPGSAAWVSEPELGASAAAGVGCWLVLRLRGGASRRMRRLALVGSMASGLLVAPLLGAAGSGGGVEIAMVDVGQGDALAIRSPAGRWILVDAGPRTPRFDAGARRVVPYLRRRGVDRLEALVLTHPDMDHVGGAPAVLEALEVGGILDPALAAGKASFEEVLAVARKRDVGWWAAGARRILELDGMELRVLHPLSEGAGAGGAEANEVSVVLLLRYGRFGALLTGDAYTDVEEAVLHRIDGPVQLLKVGHHGSATSTSRALVETLRPEVAVVPVGWRNRYGHPHPDVIDRLAGAGVRVYRTDLHGTVVVRGRSDGSWTAELPDR